MWETIAMWGGVAGLFVSIFAVIILYLTRKNILDILDKDVILFGRNFEIKKQALTNACLLIDAVIEEKDIKNSSKYFKNWVLNSWQKKTYMLLSN